MARVTNQNIEPTLVQAFRNVLNVRQTGDVQTEVVARTGDHSARYWRARKREMLSSDTGSAHYMGLIWGPHLNDLSGAEYAGIILRDIKNGDFPATRWDTLTETESYIAGSQTNNSHYEESAWGQYSEWGAANPGIIAEALPRPFVIRNEIAVQTPIGENGDGNHAGYAGWWFIYHYYPNAQHHGGYFYPEGRASWHAQIVRWHSIPERFNEYRGLPLYAKYESAQYIRARYRGNKFWQNVVFSQGFKNLNDNPHRDELKQTYRIKRATRWRGPRQGGIDPALISTVDGHNPYQATVLHDGVVNLHKKAKPAWRLNRNELRTNISAPMVQFRYISDQAYADSRHYATWNVYCPKTP